MAYTPVMTFAALTTLTAAQLNTYLRDNMEYVKARLDGLVASGVQLTRSGTQSIPDSTETLISFTGVSQEWHDWWSSGTTVTVPAAAIPAGSTQILVRCDARVKYAPNATGGRRVRILKNGIVMVSKSTSSLGGGDSTDVDTNDTFAASAGDTITLQAYQSSGGSLNVDSITFTVVRLFPVD